MTYFQHEKLLEVEEQQEYLTNDFLRNTLDDFETNQRSTNSIIRTKVMKSFILNK